MNRPFNAARRRLFRGSPEPVVRPPWTGGEAHFVALCERHGDCIDACPERIIVRGDGGFPELDFQAGACTFCGDCARACTASLFAETGTRPWGRVATVGPDCLPHRGVVCRSCADICEEEAIRFIPRLGAAAVPTVDYAACSGCGGCIAACPTRSIRLTDEA